MLIIYRSDCCHVAVMDFTYRKKKLLIIEDDADILELLSYIFQDEGYNVILSETGAEADQLSTIKPDLILLDLRLSSSGNEGAVICTRLKSQLATRHIPIILVSAETNIKEICEVCGADDYLSKPFDIYRLTNKVKELMLA